ncbi:MAG: histidine phosphatase family protein [Pseudobdellovibrio sp.]
MNVKFLLTALITGFVSFATAEPNQIVIIRHGEKLNDSDRDVSLQGCERAYLLPGFFKKFRDNTVAIYAQQAKDLNSSIRALETLAPTAKSMDIKINNSYTRKNIKDLAREILNSPEYEAKTVLIAWEHEAIVDMASEFGLKITKEINQWPASVFDQAWILSFAGKHHHKVSLQIVAEHVLPTDITSSQSGIENWGDEHSPVNNGIVVPADIAKICESGNANLNSILKAMAINSVPGL